VLFPQKKQIFICALVVVVVLNQNSFVLHFWPVVVVESFPVLTVVSVCICIWHNYAILFIELGVG